MSSHIDDEIEIYLDQVNEELHKLSNEILYGSSTFQELNDLFSNVSIDSRIYVLNRKVFADFYSALSAYNEIDEIEILDSLNDKAIAILGLLKTSNSELDSFGIMENNKLDSEINEKIYVLKNKLQILENEQKEIFKLNSIVKNSQNEANRIIEELKNKNEAYSQLIDEDSNARILKLYDEIHAREISIANKYRNWVLGIFGVIGLVLLFGFMNFSIQNWNHLRDSSYIHIPLGWENFIKTLMLFSLTTPAWYLARESSKHRKVAYKAQMLGTELASFPLYVREFKDEDRLELRKQLADRFFGQKLYSDAKSSTSSDNSLEQIKLMTEANKVLAEALKVKKATD